MDINALFVFDGTLDEVRQFAEKTEVIVTIDVAELIQKVDEALRWLPTDARYERPQLIHDCIARCLHEVGMIDGTPLTILKKNVIITAVAMNENYIVNSRLLQALWFHAASNDIRHILLNPSCTLDGQSPAAA